MGGFSLVWRAPLHSKADKMGAPFMSDSTAGATRTTQIIYITCAQFLDRFDEIN